MAAVLYLPGGERGHHRWEFPDRVDATVTESPVGNECRGHGLGDRFFAFDRGEAAEHDLGVPLDDGHQGQEVVGVVTAGLGGGGNRCRDHGTISR